MPARCAASAIGTRKLSDGSTMSDLDLRANGFVDGLAKQAARAAAFPSHVRKRVEDNSVHLMAMLGQVTCFANNFRRPDASDGDGQSLRDSEASRKHVKAGVKRKASSQLVPVAPSVQEGSRGASQPLHVFQTPRLLAVRERVLARLKAER